MRRGNEAKLVFTKSGNLVAIATGSDFTSEHEGGSKRLQSDLSDNYANEDGVIAALKKGKQVTFASVADRKRIAYNLDHIQFIEIPAKGPEGEPEAMLGFARHPLHEYIRELNFPSSFRTQVDQNVAGAWDDKSFAIRVRGKKYVKGLKAFYEAMMQKKCLFAGTFFDRKDGLTGVIIAREDYLDDESRKKMVVAQAEYESNMRLKARDDTQALHQEMVKACGNPNMHIGFLWVRWADETESSVVYSLNPGYQVKAQYGGPYTRKQLLDWAKAKFAYELRPERVAA